MPILSESTIAELISPYFAVDQGLIQKLSDYLDLLVRWNARTNLTAIRSPEEMVRRHFGESLFAGKNLGRCDSDAQLPDTLLDLGSGAGFPGLPIALLYPQIAITLAESQNKKATFLREAVRTLGVQNVEVWASRAEWLPAGREFHTVTLRAVDNMEAALAAAAPRASHQLLLLTTGIPKLPEGFSAAPPIALPISDSGILLRAKRG